MKNRRLFEDIQSTEEVDEDRKGFAKILAIVGTVLVLAPFIVTFLDSHTEIRYWYLEHVDNTIQSREVLFYFILSFIIGLLLCLISLILYKKKKYEHS